MNPRRVSLSHQGKLLKFSASKYTVDQFPVFMIHCGMSVKLFIIFRSMSTTKQGNASTTTTTKSYAQYSEKSSSMSSKKGQKSDKGGHPKKGSTSPKLPSYRGMADNCRFEGETVRHFNAGKLAVFELKAPNSRRDDVHVNIISPEKRPNIPYKVRMILHNICILFKKFCICWLISLLSF